MKISIINHQELMHQFYVKNENHTDLLWLKNQIDRGALVYVLGKNKESLHLISNLKVVGLVDDYSPSNSVWNGVNVIHSQALPPGVFVINCSTSIAPLSAQNRMNSIQEVQCIAYSDLLRNREYSLPLPSFVQEARQDFSDNHEKFRWIFAKLNDEVSLQVFNNIMSYRLTADSSWMEGFEIRLTDQYFEPFYGSLDNKVIVDCGGFDGDTTEQFKLRYPNYKKIFLFEPSTQNIEKAKQRLAGSRDIHYIEYGVSNEAGVLYFNDAAGSASSISDVGGAKIQVTTLDTYIHEEVNFIKMDLEGWEINALKGAKRLISQYSPILAIAVYHTISDFWKIPEYILSVNSNYDVYLRHYTEGWSETVMYFVPRR